MKDKEFTFEIEEGFDFILEEGQNTSINLRKISWNGRPSKIDIRKWVYSETGEKAMKGIGLTDDGANELASVLVEQGYGDSSRIIEALKKRGADLTGVPVIESINENTISDNDGEEFYNPRELFGALK